MGVFPLWEWPPAKLGRNFLFAQQSFGIYLLSLATWKEFRVQNGPIRLNLVLSSSFTTTGRDGPLFSGELIPRLTSSSLLKPPSMEIFTQFRQVCRVRLVRSQTLSGGDRPPRQPHPEIWLVMATPR